jgi:hypothetical protein
VIACYEYNSSATLGMTKYTTNNIGVALFPSPFVLLYFPRIDDITNEVESIARVVLEKIIELFRLTIAGT